GPDHPNTLTSRNNLAYAYQAAGDLNRAIPLYERTLADAERILGPDHPNTQAIRNNLAAARARASRCGWRRLLARRRSR
ncbi:MAG: tetratricopeptide repeat protein, partial [Actinomycetes bacterium]